MSSKRLVSVLTGICLMASTAAMAASPGHGHRDSYPERGRQVQMDRGHHGKAPPPRYQRHEPRYDRYDRVQHWKRGDRVPAHYRSHRYVVQDWRHRGLKAPPRGYQWVNTGANYLLIAAATGVIMQAVLAR